MEETARPSEIRSSPCKAQTFQAPIPVTAISGLEEGDAKDGSDGRSDGEHYHIRSRQLLAPDQHADSPPSSPTPTSRVDDTDETPEWVKDYLDKETIDTNVEVQNLIRKISKDSSLTESKKNHLRQSIHSHRFRRRREKEAEKLKQEFQREGSEVKYSDVMDPETGQPMLGCEHYPRYCKLKADCCKVWVVCRLCHDQVMGHPMNRFNTKEVMCMRCQHVQEVSKTCTKCHKDFADYFCDICKFYDNTPGKSIYHCADCKICRVGEGIGKDNFHCKRCDACVSKDYIKNHRCLKKSLDANCPICGQYLFTSTKPVVFMRCGHTMHSHCFDAYTAARYTCPLCHKALTNMTPYYRQIEAALKREKMPEEHQNKVSEVLCHDCDRRSLTSFHFCYLKCGHCESYNTRIINTFRKGEGSSDVLTASGSGSAAMEIVPELCESDMERAGVGPSEMSRGEVEGDVDVMDET